jgi:hypothetical protein
MCAQQGQEVEVARVVDQHCIARLEQEAADEIECMGGAVGEQDVIRARLDTLFAESARQQRAER